MRGGVASLRDDSPSASAKGAKGAERDRLVVQVEVLGLDDGVVVLVLARAISVGGETTFHGRLVGDASVDQRVPQTVGLYYQTWATGGLAAPLRQEL